jgi:hypothetical protein
MRSLLTTIVLCATSLVAPAAQGDGTREFVVTGCLLSNGYAAYQLDDATVDAIDGAAVNAETRSKGPAKWLLDGGGNLRRYTGQKMQIVGRSAWHSGDDSPGIPRLAVASVKTVAETCG